MSTLGHLNQRTYRDYPDPAPRQGRPDVELHPIGQTLPRPPRRVRQTTILRDAAMRVRAALDDVFDEVAELYRWGWPHSYDGEPAEYACKTVVDAGRDLLEHDDLDLADLLVIVQPIIDAHWLDRTKPRWTLNAAHEAVEQLRRAVAAARYGTGEAISAPARVRVGSLPAAAVA